MATSEPEAYLYTSDAGDKELILNCNGEYARRLLELGYTEAPLYTSAALSSTGTTEIGQAASEALMYLQTGFIECDGCGAEVPTCDTDAAYALRDAGVTPAPHDSPKPTPPVGDRAAERARECLALCLEENGFSARAQWVRDKEEYSDIPIGVAIDAMLAFASQKAAQVGAGTALDVLADLSSYVGAGIGDESTTPEQYGERIRWGIDHLCSAASQKGNSDA